MKRIGTSERPFWQEQAESFGFKFHTIDGERYWDESAYYQFSLSQIEDDIESPTKEIHDMCFDIVSMAVADEEILKKLHIPETFWEQIRYSWLQGHPHLYGRMDFSYSGTGPAKLLELNYDTPTSLFESAFFQYVWLSSMIESGRLPAHADQYNSIQERLTQAFAQIPSLPMPLYFASVKDSHEDYGTVEYMRDIAHSTGIYTKMIAIEDIGYDSERKLFVDLDGENIPSLFKLYPWEHIFEDEFGKYVPSSSTLFIEPTWKSVISNKGILPLLWEKFKGHPNLLETYIDTNPSKPLKSGWVRKPFFSREGANVEIKISEDINIKVDGPYTDAPFILQEFSPLPKFGNNYTLIGSWVVGDAPCGIGIREDDSLITKDSSRFLPHIILD
ncbi:glutathionylspermidine synthase family protein [Pseudomonas luteola]